MRRLVQLVLVTGVVFGLGVNQGHTWTKNLELLTTFTIVTDVFCRSANCYGPPGERPPSGSGPFTQEEWHQAIQDAVAQWNNTGADIPIRTRRAQEGESPCALPFATVPVILADEGPAGNVCPSDAPIPQGEGGIYRLFPEQRLYISTAHGGGFVHLRRLLVHEIGHVIGLGHPDDVGQDVRAVMNSDLGCNLQGEPFRYCDELQPDDIDGVQYVYGLKQEQEPAALVGFLENPRNESSHSGVSVISGWVCEAGTVEIQIWSPSGGWVDRELAAYGTKRVDTEYTPDGQILCGDTDNGFGLLFNWNNRREGEHIVDVLVDGELLDRATVYLTKFGTDFLRGKRGRYVLDNFPDPGQSVVIEWEEALQNFVIVERR